MPLSATHRASARTSTVLALSALSLALGGTLGCSVRNVVGELPDGGAAGAGGGTPVAACGVPATSQVPRLTNAQYDRTVRDLLGVTGLTAYAGQPPSTILAPDGLGPLTDIGWRSYWAVAQAIAAQVIGDPALRPRFLACTPSGDGTACLHETIISFGRRAFRRPLTAAEVARFDKIVAARALNTPTGAVAEVAEVLLETFLASPSFIQRAELATRLNPHGGYALSPWEVASRLAYMLWGSVPDQILNQAADADQLATKEQVRAQAVRMLADPKARELVAAFHRTYLGMFDGRWSGSTGKDQTLFPAYTATFADAALAEVERFFDAVVFDQQGSFQSLLTSPLGFVTRETASTYGLDASRYSTTLTEVTLNAAQRPGFLSRVGFLSAFSLFAGTSPIRRGGFVMNRILGTNVPAEPVNTPPPAEGTNGFPTTRAEIEALTGDAPCAPCHRTYIDPPGFVLEAYDAIGAWRTNEASTGAPIDTAAEVMIDGKPVAVRDPAELMARLAASAGAQQTYARSLVSFAYERQTDALDACMVASLAANVAGGGYRVIDLFVDLTQFDAFKVRTREVTP